MKSDIIKVPKAFLAFDFTHGDERISTGILKYDKRVVMQSHFKHCNLKINDNKTVLKAA